MNTAKYPHIKFSILVGTGLGLLFFVAAPSPAFAASIVPTTPCDAEEVSIESTDGLVPNMILENGTTTFSYGINNIFVTKSVTDSAISFDIKLLISQNSQGTGTIKFLALDSHCHSILGFSPIFHNLNDLTENVAVLDAAGNMTLNGNTQRTTPFSQIKYIYAEVSNGYGAGAFGSYSYLVDIDNLQNPEEEISSPPEPPGKRPVLIIPGIMGSELYDGPDLVWPNVSKLLIHPLDTFLGDSLSLDEQGNSIKDISVGNVVKEINVESLGFQRRLTDSFTGLINELLDQDYALNQNLFLFPYDWRLDDDFSAGKLKLSIDSIKTKTGFDKIDIIAHSMGGLVAEDYIHQSSSDSINKLIFVGTPHLGAPKAANALLAGDLGIPFDLVEGGQVKKISQNSPAIYELLPQGQYFNVAQSYLKPMPDTGENTLNFSESFDFLSKIGKNLVLLAKAQQFFRQDLPDLNYGDTKIYNIVGCKVSTQAFYNVDGSNGNILNIKFATGDGTVPFASADYSAGTKYYVKNVKHSELPSNAGVRDLILGLLNEEEVLSANVSRSADFCGRHGKELSWHSPVSVQVYDSLGNHAGPDNDGVVENNIPGATYEITNGETYIFLPTDDNQVYDMTGTGTAKGSFDLFISDIDNDEPTDVNLFNDVAIIPNSIVKLNIFDQSDDSQIDFDYNSTGNYTKLGSTGKFDDIDEAWNSSVTPAATPAPSGGGGPLIMDLNTSNHPENGAKILGESISSLPDASLVLDTTDGRTVYIIGNNGKKYGFTTEKVFLGMGFGFEQVILADVSKYEMGGIVSFPDEIHPNGSLVLEGQTIWFINHEKRRAFATLEEFISKGYRLDQVVKMNKADLSLSIN